MISRKITDKVILKANKLFMLIDSVKLKTAEVNSCAEETKEDLIEGTNTFKDQWQVVANSALSGGFKLASNQQSIMVDSLDSIGEEFSKGYKRIAVLFRNSN